MISVIEPALVWDDRSSGYQVRVTAGGTHTEKLEHGPRYGFGLFQHHEVSGIRQVDHSHPLAQLLTQRMPVPRRSRCIIEPLDHEKGGGPAAPPIFKGYVPAGREMREMDRRPAFDLFQYLGIGCWREPARAQPGDTIATVHLDLRRIAKGRPERRRRPDEATCCSKVTLRTTDGRSTARQRAIRLPKACPTKCAGPQPIASMTPATSPARSCKVVPSREPRLPPTPRILIEIVWKPAVVPTANPKPLTATANRLILAADERSLQVDLVRLDWTVQVAGCVGSRDPGPSTPTQRAAAQIPEAIGVRQY